MQNKGKCHCDKYIWPGLICNALGFLAADKRRWVTFLITFYRKRLKKGGSEKIQKQTETY